MIYILESGDNFKVGFTSNWESRLTTYKTHNPNVELVKVYEEGTEFIEKGIHKELSDYKVQGEWFLKFSNYLEVIEGYYNKYNSILYKDPVETLNYGKKGSLNKRDLPNLFFDKADYVCRLSQAGDIRLLITLYKLASPKTLTVHITPKVRRDIVRMANISISNMSKNLKRLEEEGFLTIDSGDCVLNPYLL